MSFLRTILISFACLTAPQATDSLAASRRVVAAAALSAKEYAQGVTPQGGRIVAPEEVDEAKLFIQQARFDLPGLPAAVRPAADSALRVLAALLDRLAAPDSVERVADALVARISAAVGGALEPPPSRPPSLARGAAVYREQCAACHGETGRGDGPKAKSLKGPPPANLADPAVMGRTSLLEIFRKTAIGVPGTAMPEFAEDLSEDDRWAVAAYVATMQYGGSATAATFAAVRRQIDSALVTRSDKIAFDAYLTFEQVETEVRAKNAGLASDLEGAFAWLRTRVARADSAELAAIRQRLLSGLERAERVVADRPSAMSLFASSFVLLVREGFEAILIVAALMTFLSKAGAPHRRRDVGRGAWLAVLASLVTWALVELLFQVTPGQREVIEGFTMLLAAAVLFYVSYWLLSKIEAAKWTAFVRSKMESALSSGSGLALTAVAFLAVYREGFETILFYKALFTSSGGAVLPVLGGLGAGAVGLVAVYVAINQLGLRVAMKPFFAVTGVMLYYMAFVFAGKGVAELQEGRIVPLTLIDGAPRIPVLGIYPTLESLVLQGLLVLLALVALVWTMRPVGRQPSAISGEAGERPSGPGPLAER
ncbi:MAG TPA: cytochrome c/FTR1 family iron permease [Gemmatimonadales bacterium]|nr:cytochrome c/FTR1 family iron permease [Gemmatimonadales bacterium]